MSSSKQHGILGQVVYFHDCEKCFASNLSEKKSFTNCVAENSCLATKMRKMGTEL